MRPKISTSLFRYAAFAGVIAASFACSSGKRQPVATKCPANKVLKDGQCVTRTGESEKETQSGNEAGAAGEGTSTKYPTRPSTANSGLSSGRDPSNPWDGLDKSTSEDLDDTDKSEVSSPSGSGGTTSSSGSTSGLAADAKKDSGADSKATASIFSDAGNDVSKATSTNDIFGNDYDYRTGSSDYGSGFGSSAGIMAGTYSNADYAWDYFGNRGDGSLPDSTTSESASQAAKTEDKNCSDILGSEKDLCDGVASTGDGANASLGIGKVQLYLEQVGDSVNGINNKLGETPVVAKLTFENSKGVSNLTYDMMPIDEDTGTGFLLNKKSPFAQALKVPISIKFEKDGKKCRISTFLTFNNLMPDGEAAAGQALCENGE
jgi:hypothetical protein